MDVFKPQFNTKIELPFFSSQVQAGFPSPADDHLEKTLDLNSYLIQNPDSTYFVRVSGDSMIGAGIFPQDILIVDRSLNPKNGSIIIAVVDGEMTLKRFFKHEDRIVLKAENKKYKDIILTAEQDTLIWGVVIHSIHKTF